MANVSVTVVQPQIVANNDTSNVSVTTTSSQVTVDASGTSPAVVRSYISGEAPILYDAVTGVISIDEAAVFDGKTTDDLTEGSVNLYLNGAGTTSDLTEGTNLYHTVTRAREAITLVDLGGDGSLSYNTAAGIFTFTGPTASETRQHFSAANGITYSPGTGVISQNLSTDLITEGTANLFYTEARTLSTILNNTVTVKDIHETVVDAGDIGGNVTLDVSQGTIQRATLLGNITGLAFSNINTGSAITILLDQTAIGLAQLDTTSFPAAWSDWKWTGDYNSLNGNPNSRDIITVVYDGSYYNASVLNLDFSPGISNDQLVNSSITINGYDTALGSSVTLTTTDISEGTNQYFTTDRANTAITTHFADATNSPFTINGDLEVAGNINYVNVVDMLVNDQSITLNYGNATARDAFIYVDRSGSALANAYLTWDETDDAWKISDGTSTFKIPTSTTDLAEGTNLYYTDSRANAAMDAYLTSITANVDSVNGATGVVVLDTDDVAQGITNKYYSSTLFDTDFATKTTTDLTEGTNLYYTDGRADARVDLQTGVNLDLSFKSTTDLAEGTNLYWTTDRGNTNSDAWLTTKTTTDLTEGTNLYYTTARANSAIDARVTKPFVEALGVAAEHIVFEPNGLFPANIATVQAAIDDLQLHKLNVSALTSSVTFFPTTAASDIGGYSRQVTTTADPDYNTTAVNVSTIAITTSNVLVASLAGDPGELVGNTTPINITTVGNIRKTVGGTSQNAQFYFRVYKRTAAGTETLIGTSSITPEITSATYAQFSAIAIIADTEFTATDRVVTKFYADNLGGGAPVYQFQFGGATPVRTLFPVPVSVVPVNHEATEVTVDTTAFNGVLSAADDTAQKAFETLDAITTTVIPEGTNLYYTDARSQAALSVTTAAPSGDGSLTYNDTTGEFTFTPADAGLSDYGDANVVTLLETFGSNNLNTTGNVTAGKLKTADTVLPVTRLVKGVETLSANIAGRGYSIFPSNVQEPTDIVHTDSAPLIEYLVGGVATLGSDQLTITELIDNTNNIVANVGDLTPGYVISAPSFTPDSYITSVDAGNSTVTLNKPATSSSTFDQNAGNSLTAGLIDTDTGLVVVLLPDYNDPANIQFIVPQNYPYGYPRTGPVNTDFNIVAVGTNADYTVADLSNIMVAKTTITPPNGVLNTPLGLTVGKNTDLTNRGENDGLTSFGINVMWDGTQTADQFGDRTATVIPQMLFKSYTDGTPGGGGVGGPRLFFVAADGNANDNPYDTYPKANQELGRLTWWGTNGENLVASTFNPPAYITVQAANDWATQSGSVSGQADVYMAANSGDPGGGEGAETYLAYKGGDLVLGSAQGTTFAPAANPAGFTPEQAYAGAYTKWATVNYADTVAQSGAKFTVTNGGSSGAGVVGDMQVSLKREGDGGAVISREYSFVLEEQSADLKVLIDGALHTTIKANGEIHNAAGSKYLTAADFNALFDARLADASIDGGGASQGPAPTPDYDGGTASTTSFEFTVDGGSATPTFTDSVEGGNAERNSIVEGGSAGTTTFIPALDGGNATPTFTAGIEGGNASGTTVIESGSAGTTEFSAQLDGGEATTTEFTDTAEGGNATGASIIEGGFAGTTVYGSQLDGGASSPTFDQTTNGGNA